MIAGIMSQNLGPVRMVDASSLIFNKQQILILARLLIECRRQTIVNLNGNITTKIINQNHNRTPKIVIMDEPIANIDTQMDSCT